MAQIFPFQPYRYSPRAGRLSDLVTQPYDKISPDMRARYLDLNPHNLVRIILGERLPSDDSASSVYTRAAAHLTDWIARGVLVREPQPCLFAYFQDFCVPDTGERLSRRGFIGLGAVEDYSAGIVYRHEQTLSGPKQDRLELLRHTHAHFGQIFMLYPDPAREVDGVLEECSKAAPDRAVVDEYGAEHRLWRISDPARVSAIAGLMAQQEAADCRRPSPLRNRTGFSQRKSGLGGRGARDDDVREHALTGPEDSRHSQAGQRPRELRRHFISYGHPQDISGGRGDLAGTTAATMERCATRIHRSSHRRSALSAAPAPSLG